MRLLAISVVVAVAMVGCTDGPQNYSCAYINQPMTSLSLSVKPTSATLDKMEFTKICKKEGNVVTYGQKQVDCDGLTAQTEYVVMSFDQIVGRADLLIFSSKSLLTEAFKCSKVN